MCEGSWSAAFSRSMQRSADANLGYVEANRERRTNSTPSLGELSRRQAFEVCYDARKAR